MRYLKEKNKDVCPAKDGRLVEEFYCSECPYRRTIYISKKGQATVQCQYQDDEELMEAKARHKPRPNRRGHLIMRKRYGNEDCMV